MRDVRILYHTTQIQCHDSYSLQMHVAERLTKKGLIDCGFQTRREQQQNVSVKQSSLIYRCC